MKNFLIICLGLLFITLILNCTKIIYISEPSVKTISVTNIKSTSATSGGNVVDDGGKPIIERGLCWGIEPYPTKAHKYSSNGSGMGNFTQNLENLTENTVYHVRAYATNSVGTSYGQNISFTTQPIEDIDGNTYDAIQIGSQTWLSSNLKTTKYNDGTDIPNVVNSLAWILNYQGAYCDYNNVPSNSNSNGRLYNWFAVSTGKLCPKGWHVPSDIEWEVLITYLGGVAVAGGKLKTIGITSWQSPNLDASNSVGFNSLPSGCRYEGLFRWFGQRSEWWSTTIAANTQHAYTYSLAYDRKSVFIGSMIKNDGLSVRCIKDF